MGGIKIFTQVFLLLNLFVCSGNSIALPCSNVTRRVRKEVDHEGKLNASISTSKKDITTPITTVPTITPIIPTSSTPIINPNSNPDSTPPVIMTPVTIPTTTSPVTSGGKSWCIASQSASKTALQVGLDYACGYGGADCSGIQAGGSCYNPNTLYDHASYAFNDYYKKNPIPSSCNFGGTAVTTSTDPSTGACQYPSTSTSASILNTTNSNGSTVYGAVPSNPTPSWASAKIKISFSHFFIVTCLHYVVAAHILLSLK